MLPSGSAAQQYNSSSRGSKELASQEVVPEQQVKQLTEPNMPCLLTMTCAG
jgi:hypothetical protein